VRQCKSKKQAQRLATDYTNSLLYCHVLQNFFKMHLVAVQLIPFNKITTCVSLFFNHLHQT